ncbi:MAG: hypothetical protein JNM70_07385 [Anaerolineae bacterium]|nr:hypothetical protein [Anaerolineae bacterium]
MCGIVPVLLDPPELAADVAKLEERPAEWHALESIMSSIAHTVLLDVFPAAAPLRR